VTAVSRAVTAIESAHCEAFSQRRGVAIVKLMGRDSGFIALHATMASGDVNLCLIPECKFELDTVVAFVSKRLERRDHCVVVIAEGAGQECFGAGNGERDASGNVKFADVGVELKKVFDKRIPEVQVKYIDPSYTIRSAPAEPHDEEVRRCNCFQFLILALVLRDDSTGGGARGHGGQDGHDGGVRAGRLLPRAAGQD
jgi:6-phosphofructokinase 1